MSINQINNYTIYGSSQNIPNSRNENTNIKNENNNDFTEGLKLIIKNQALISPNPSQDQFY